MSIVLIILILGLAFIVLSRLKLIIAQQTHLEDEDLEDYLEGRYGPKTTAYKQAVAHLGVCEKCRKRLREMEEGLID